jgi:hypothetical protein
MKTSRRTEEPTIDLNQAVSNLKLFWSVLTLSLQLEYPLPNDEVSHGKGKTLIDIEPNQFIERIARARKIGCVAMSRSQYLC